MILSFRPVADGDLEFLYNLFASTRLSEMSATGWSDGQVEEFLRMQFRLQHTQYMQNYKGASFDIILVDSIPAGRLYVDRGEEGIRVIEISILPEFRRKGIGSSILRGLTEEADAIGQTISLHVEMNNPILGFYKTLGFREKELRGIYFYMEREVNRFPAGVVGKSTN
jgi:ribosomal protein S18 acetylase RimI-like enzyme